MGTKVCRKRSRRVCKLLIKTQGTPSFCCRNLHRSSRVPLHFFVPLCHRFHQPLQHQLLHTRQQVSGARAQPQPNTAQPHATLTLCQIGPSSSDISPLATRGTRTSRLAQRHARRPQRSSRFPRLTPGTPRSRPHCAARHSSSTANSQALQHRRHQQLRSITALADIAAQPRHRTSRTAASALIQQVCALSTAAAHPRQRQRAS